MARRKSARSLPPISSHMRGRLQASEAPKREPPISPQRLSHTLGEFEGHDRRHFALAGDGDVCDELEGQAERTLGDVMRLAAPPTSYRTADGNLHLRHTEPLMVIFAGEVAKRHAIWEE